MPASRRGIPAGLIPIFTAFKVSEGDRQVLEQQIVLFQRLAGVPLQAVKGAR